MRDRAAFVALLFVAALASALPVAGKGRPLGPGSALGAFAAPPGGAAAVGGLTCEALEAALRQGGLSDPRLIELAVRTQAAKQPYSVALFCLRQATTMNPLDLRYPFLMGCTLLHVGQGNEALAFIDEAVKAAPTDPRPLNLKAEYLRGLGDQDAYVATLRRSLEVDSGQGKIDYWLARALLQRDTPGDLADAFEHAKLVVGNSKARAEELADRFPAGEQRAWFLDRAAAIRADKAVAALREQRGPADPRIYAPAGAGLGRSVDVFDRPSAPLPSNDNSYVETRGTGYAATRTAFRDGGRYSVMGRDEYYQIKAGNLPYYERLRALREQRGPGPFSGN